MKSIHSLALIGIASSMLIANTTLAASRADNRINGEIFHTFLVNDALVPGQGSQLIATTDNGVVTLNGLVPSQADKQQLHDVITSLPGVRRVDDSHVSTEIVIWPNNQYNQ
jgi:osmotically-inducible protein OsmY